METPASASSSSTRARPPGTSSTLTQSTSQKCVVKPASCSSVAGALGVVHDEAHDAVLGGLGGGEAADVDALAAEDVGDLGQPTAAVLEEHRELPDLHCPTSSLDRGLPRAKARWLTSRIFAGTAAARPRAQASSEKGSTAAAAPSSATFDGARRARLAGQALGVDGQQAHAAQRRRRRAAPAAPGSAARRAARCRAGSAW